MIYFWIAGRVGQNVCNLRRETDIQIYAHSLLHPLSCTHLAIYFFFELSLTSPAGVYRVSAPLSTGPDLILMLGRIYLGSFWKCHRYHQVVGGGERRDLDDLVGFLLFQPLRPQPKRLCIIRRLSATEKGNLPIHRVIWTNWLS